MLIADFAPATTAALTGLISATFGGAPETKIEGRATMMLFPGASIGRVQEIVAADPNFIGLADEHLFGEVGGLTFRLRPHLVITDLD